MYCSNCGHELLPDAKFCSNCGAPVESGASAPLPNETDRERERREDFARAWGSQQSEPTEPVNAPADEPEARDEPVATEPIETERDGDEFTGGFATDRKPTWEVERERLRNEADDEWSMSSLGPPPRQRKRTWLWVLLGTIALVFLACCVLMGWVTFTDSGQNWIEGIATQAAEELDRATREAATPQP